MDSAIVMLGWLIFALGAGIIIIATVKSTAKIKSPTRRVADALSGGFFCLLGLVGILSQATSAQRKMVLVGACVCGLLSWGLGRRAGQVDRATSRS